MESVQKSVDVPGGTCSSATIVWTGYPPGASHFLAESRDSRYLGRENRYVPNLYATASRLVDLIGSEARNSIQADTFIVGLQTFEKIRL